MSIRAWVCATALGLSASASLAADHEQTYALDRHSYENATNYSAVTGGPFHVGANASEADDGCQQGEDKRSSDLCAQWKAADAAAESAEATWLQFWTGTFIGLLTFLAAGAAAVYARAAALHTGESVEVSNSMGRAQARAYVDVIAAKIHDDAEYISVRVTLRNEGQTPAKAVTLYGATEVVDVRLPIGPPPFASLLEGHSWGPLRSGGEITAPIVCDETTRHYDAVGEARGPLSIRAFGRVRYVTIFDETYETEFSFHTNRTKVLFKSGPNGSLVEDPLVMSHEPAALRTYLRVDQPRSGE